MAYGSINVPGVFDPISHVSKEDRARWNQGVENASQAYELAVENARRISNLDSRLSRLEAALFNDISANPFLASFEDVTGIVIVRGIWNKEKQRVEC